MAALVWRILDLVATEEGDQSLMNKEKHMASSSWPLPNPCQSECQLTPDLGVCLCVGIVIDFLTIHGL